MLTLMRANKSRGGGHWSDDDYDVREGNRVIGRIMLHPQAPKDQPWFLDDHGACRTHTINH